MIREANRTTKAVKVSKRPSVSSTGGKAERDEALDFAGLESEVGECKPQLVGTTDEDVRAVIPKQMLPRRKNSGGKD